ncbi:MAG: tetratricopeptide repeat protein, partial [Anaerolineales bacterium]
TDYAERGIPAVRAFRNGQVVAEFGGLRTEPQIREFLKDLTPAPSDLAVGRANSLLGKSEWQQAEEAFRKELYENPDHPGALIGLAKSLLAQGRPVDALPVLREFPVSKEYPAAEQMLPLAQAMAEMEMGEIKTKKNDEHAALYANSLRLAGRGQIPAALDGLLEILRADKQYRKGEVRQVILGLLQLLGEDNQQARAYRAELASHLF